MYFDFSRLNDLNGLFQLISTLLWGAYVYYTIKTFKEIKRQTELQSEAFLLISSKIATNLPSERNVSEGSRQLYSKWREILGKNVPAALQPEKYIILTLNNTGRSEIVSWHIDIQLSIEPGDYLQKNFNINGESLRWHIDNQSYQDIISPDKTIDIPIALTGTFPIAKFSWSVRYTDSRNVAYQKFAGDPTATDRNVLANPLNSQEAIEQKMDTARQIAPSAHPTDES